MCNEKVCQVIHGGWHCWKAVRVVSHIRSYLGAILIPTAYKAWLSTHNLFYYFLGLGGGGFEIMSMSHEFGHLAIALAGRSWGTVGS